MDSPLEYGPVEGPSQKVSVSMPAGRIAALKARVGARGFSAYVSAAVERQIRRDLLDELIRASEQETGEIPQAMRDRAAEAILTAESLAAMENSEDVNRGDETWRDRPAS